MSASIGWFLVYLNILLCSKKYKKGYSCFSSTAVVIVNYR